jgi:hypothetical protein
MENHPQIFLAKMFYSFMPLALIEQKVQDIFAVGQVVQDVIFVLETQSLIHYGAIYGNEVKR